MYDQEALLSAVSILRDVVSICSTHVSSVHTCVYNIARIVLLNVIITLQSTSQVLFVPLNHCHVVYRVISFV